jgi:hypothetical protein
MFTTVGLVMHIAALPLPPTATFVVPVVSKN